MGSSERDLIKAVIGLLTLSFLSMWLWLGVDPVMLAIEMLVALAGFPVAFGVFYLLFGVSSLSVTLKHNRGSGPWFEQVNDKTDYRARVRKEILNPEKGEKDAQE